MGEGIGACRRSRSRRGIWIGSCRSIPRSCGCISMVRPFHAPQGAGSNYKKLGDEPPDHAIGRSRGGLLQGSSGLRRQGPRSRVRADAGADCRHEHAGCDARADSAPRGPRASTASARPVDGRQGLSLQKRTAVAARARHCRDDPRTRRPDRSPSEESRVGRSTSASSKGSATATATSSSGVSTSSSIGAESRCAQTNSLATTMQGSVSLPPSNGCNGAGASPMIFNHGGSIA